MVELEPCTSGGWKARFTSFEPVAERVRANEAVEVDTEHLLLWHRDEVKCSFVKSSGVMMMRTEDKRLAADLVQHAVASASDAELG